MPAPMAATVLEILGVVGAIVLLVLAAGVAFFAYQIFRLRRAMATAMRTMPAMIATREEASRRAAAAPGRDAIGRAMRLAASRAEAFERHRDAFLAASGWTIDRWDAEGDRVLFVEDESAVADLLAMLAEHADVAPSGAEAERLASAGNVREAFATWAASRADRRIERVAHLESKSPTDAYLIRVE